MSQLKLNFAVNSKYEAFYTGGKIQISSDGVYMFCGCGNKVNILEIATGKIHSAIGKEEDEEISSFTLSPDNQYLILASQHLLLRQWKWKEKELVRSWKAVHVAPVVCMAFDSTSTLLATGSADSTIKIWDIEKQYCTHNLRGHQGVISVLTFHPDISKLQLYSAADDYKVRVWNLSNSQCAAVVEAHYSIVTSIVFSHDGKTAFTSGRDGVVAIWDTEQMKVSRTIPVFESVESLLLLPENQDLSHIGVDSEVLHFVTAGSKGVLRVWNSKKSKCVHTTAEVHAKYAIPSKEVVKQKEKINTQDEAQNIVQMIYNETLNGVAVVTYDQNISVIGLDNLRLKKQFSGNNDEIVDIKFLDSEEKYAVVATNSMYIKVFQLDTWDCEILYGHTDIVLSIDVFTVGNYFVSSGKDNTVRLWQIKPEEKEVRCLAVGQGHTHAVGAVAVSRTKPAFFVSGSEDQTLKLWNVPVDVSDTQDVEIHAAFTERAHDKEINSLVVAPNDKFFASGSMDKTAKLWSAKDLTLLGVMRGHKRGVWCVQFSLVDKILATSSGDGTVKLWSLTDFSCVRTFEGHDCAVLKVTFLTRGMQILSCGTDGLIKLWTIKTNECVKTFDEHEDKVWALAVSKTDDKFITGGADSTLIEWKDVTESELNEARAKQEDFILKEQELSNLIQRKKYLKAIGLAITLEQPFRVLSIIKEILSEEQGADQLQTTLEKMRLDQIDAILRFAVQWNTNSRHCHDAQFVLSSVLKTYPPTELRKFPNIKSSLEGLIPYTERHFARMSRLLQQAMFVEYSWYCMKGVATDGTLPSTSIKPDQIVIDRTKQLVDIEGTNVEADSSSESDMETDINTVGNTATAVKPDQIKTVTESSVNDGASSSESDLDTDNRDFGSESVAAGNIESGKQDHTKQEPHGRQAQRKDKLKQKKRKQKMNLRESTANQETQKLTDQFTVVKQKRKLKPQNSLQSDSAQDSGLSNRKKNKPNKSDKNSENVVKKSGKSKKTRKISKLKKQKQTGVR